MKFLSLFTLLILPLILVSQSITQTDIMPIGLHTPVHLSAYQSTSPGVNMTWDLSDMVTDSSFVIDIVAPDATPQGANFPLSNAVEMRSGDHPGQQYTYHEVNAGGWYDHGYATETTFHVHVDLGIPDPWTVLEFPTALDSVWTDQVGDGWTTGEGRTITADGFGSLVMPYGTVTNVLRVRTHQYTISPWTDMPESNTISFYRPGVGWPLLTTVSGSVGLIGWTEPTEWIDAELLTGVDGAGLQPIGMDVYPNPSSQDARVVFGAQGHISVDLIDVSGRIVRSESLGTRAPGIHEHVIDVSGLASGAYSVRIQNDRNEYGVARLVVE